MFTGLSHSLKDKVAIAEAQAKVSELRKESKAQEAKFQEVL